MGFRQDVVHETRFRQATEIGTTLFGRTPIFCKTPDPCRPRRTTGTPDSWKQDEPGLGTTPGSWRQDYTIKVAGLLPWVPKTGVSFLERHFERVSVSMEHMEHHFERVLQSILAEMFPT
ncbi:hypothetical protein RclHR1_11160004 [Rhizophagus clarus]|uniref:Uncharacterized protein n=1 Tax=Rhizophagus clarus TaxID=94130 RepID=A0A2Z6QV83_9GLOM|nr:hypothetical protein RclHR1_11160004 [Rhizophagus clarus]